MTDPTPNRPPLWRVMQDARIGIAKDGDFELVQPYAAELRAIAEQVEARFIMRYANNRVLQVIDWLRAEADRAEAGE